MRNVEKITINYFRKQISANFLEYGDFKFNSNKGILTMRQSVDLSQNLDTSGLYRLPWTMTDNSSTWLEITRDCDITCEYCIQEHDCNTTKSLEQVKFEIKELMRMRKCDTMIVAGGEPLIHPDLIEIVKAVKEANVKPVIITNAVKLDKPLIQKLKDAGLFGFILHVDAGQFRPGWTDKTEKELNELRQQLTDDIHSVGGLICSFITTITPNSLEGVADIAEWMQRNCSKVVQNIFVPVRGWHPDDPWDIFCNGKKIDVQSTAYDQEMPEQYEHLNAKDIYKRIEKVIPNFEFSSYLGGTEVANAPKWILGFSMQAGGKAFGSIGAKTMELLQTANHAIKGAYLAFGKPWLYKAGKLLFGLTLFDKNIKKSLSNYVKMVLKNPFLIFKPVTLQTIIIMQPFDLLENGDCDTCDGCPNKTYYEGRLVSECRMDEYIRYGKLIQYAPKEKSQETVQQ